MKTFHVFQKPITYKKKAVCLSLVGYISYCAFLLGSQVALLPSSASAQSLRDAMVTAYKNNLSLQAERFRSRASDEGVAIARSGYRPQISAFANYRVSSEGDNENLNFDDGNAGYGVQLNQKIFDGFSTYYSVEEAESNVLVARNQLLAAENQILFDTAQAYFNVLLNEGIVLLRKRNLTSLRRELIGAQDRYDRGQGTVTDIEQVKIRLAVARSSLKAAEAQLQSTQLRYARITRKPPQNLKMSKFPRQFLPNSLSAAIELASQKNPMIAAAKFRSQAAAYAIDKNRAAFLPNADLSAGYSSENDVTFNDVISNDGSDDNFFVRAQINIPLFQGGQVSARVREASNRAESLERTWRDAEVRMAENVGSVWAELKSASQRRISDQEAVTASERALEGIREELRVGQRTVTDVLDADRELVETRIRLLTTNRDHQVSAYALLNSIGTLTIDRIDPAVERYDPQAYYQQVRGKLFGTDISHSSDNEYLGGNNLSSSEEQ